MVKKKRCWERSRQCIAQTLSCFQLARHRKAQMHCDIKASWLMHATSRPNCSEHVQMIPDVYSSCHRDALTCAQLYVFRLWEARIKFTLGTCFEQMFCKELLYIIAGSESPVRRYQVPSFAGAKPYGKAQSRLQKHLGRTWSDLIFLNREFGCDGLAATVSRNADQWQSWMIQIRAYSSQGPQVVYIDFGLSQAFARKVENVTGTLAPQVNSRASCSHGSHRATFISCAIQLCRLTYSYLFAIFFKVL